MSDSTSPALPKIRIVKTGEKFPPLKYQADASPDTAIVPIARRNGQIVHARRVLQPTMVSSKLSIECRHPQ
jgi:hypothetical protein